jgi:hypothetical protein
VPLLNPVSLANHREGVNDAENSREFRPVGVLILVMARDHKIPCYPSGVVLLAFEDEGG